jgi:hypothetical protein
MYICYMADKIVNYIKYGIHFPSNQTYKGILRVFKRKIIGQS